MNLPKALALILVTLPVFAAHSTPRPQEPTLTDIAWMAGHWASEANGTHTEELWLAPAGGIALGMNRSVLKGRPASFEYLRIEERKDGLVYVASPGGRGATDFPLADIGENFVEFEAPEHDFPQRIRYELHEESALHVRVSGVIDGVEHAEEWVWKRQ